MIDRTWGKDGVIYYNCSGVVSIQDLVQSLQETVQDDRYSKTNASLWDLRGAQYTFSMQEHDQTAPLFNSILGKPDKVRKTAWIVAFKMSEAIINLYYENHEWPQEWECFQSTDDARTWLGVTA